jgi:hypothetical protein
MSQSKTAGRRISVEEFDRLFGSLKNWGRWGPDDELGTLNYLTADNGPRAAAVATGDRVSVQSSCGVLRKVPPMSGARQCQLGRFWDSTDVH